MRYFIKAATVGKGILFLLLAGLCIPSAAQKRLAVEAEHFRIEWQEKSDFDGLDELCIGKNLLGKSVGQLWISVFRHQTRYRFIVRDDA